MFHEVHDKDIALFQQPELEVGTKKTEWITFRPINQLTDGSAIEFHVPGTSTTYMNLKKTLLLLKLKIVKANGEDIAEAEKVGLTNAPLHSMFSQVDFNLQQQPTTETGTNYPYKAYLDILLDATDEHELSSQLFIMDTAGRFDITDPSGSNKGLFDRAKVTSGGKTIDIIGKLHVDLCQQDRLLVNGVPLNIKLWQSSNAFRLSAESDAEAYRVKIVEAALQIATVKVNPSVIIGHSDALKSSDAMYPYTRSVIKTYAVPRGQYSFTTDDLFQGEVPEKLTVGLVSSAAHHGSLVKNPYNFQTFNCNFIGFYVDGQSVPTQPLQPDYKNELFVHTYHRLHESRSKDSAIFISRADFKAGSCLYTFKPEGDDKHRLSERAHTRLELKFKEALPETCTVIVYAKFVALMRIDASRSVTLE